MKNKVKLLKIKLNCENLDRKCLSTRWLRKYIKLGILILVRKEKMNNEEKPKVLRVDIDNFVFYQKSKVGLLVGKAIQPLISQDKILLNTGDDCKIKFKVDISNLDFQQLVSAKSVDFAVKNFFEEKNFKGSLVKQFTADTVEKYNADNKREIVRF